MSNINGCGQSRGTACCVQVPAEARIVGIEIPASPSLRTPIGKTHSCSLMGNTLLLRRDYSRRSPCHGYVCHCRVPKLKYGSMRIDSNTVFFTRANLDKNKTHNGTGFRISISSKQTHTSGSLPSIIWPRDQKWKKTRARVLNGAGATRGRSACTGESFKT